MKVLKNLSILITILYVFSFSLIEPSFAQGSQFTDITSTTGINYSFGISTFGAGVSVCDFNNDGWDDLSFGSQEGSPLSFYTNVNGVFTPNPIPDLSGELGDQRCILWADFDNDGDKDIFFSNRGGVNKLYRNDGNSDFTDITTISGMSNATSYTYSACWGDYDNDGWLDLYYLNRYPNLLINAPSALYHNNGDGTFTDVTIAAGVSNLSGLGLGVVMIDYNNDGWSDIYIANDLCFTTNVLYENNGDGTFTDVSDPSTTGLAVDGMGIGVGDFDLNGYFDLYNASTYNTCPTQGNILLKNQDGTFEEVATTLDVSVDKRSWGINFVDIDNDMDEDLFVANSGFVAALAKNYLFYNQADGTFERDSLDPMTLNVGDSFGSTHSDWNNDGFIDITVMNGATILKLWENNGGTNNWLKIDLQGLISNRDAIGVWVELWIDGEKQIRYTSSGGSYASQNSNTLFFGTGVHTVADSIKLKWPSGVENTFLSMQTNERYLILEDTVNSNINCSFTYYQDADNDGFGDLSVPQISCSQPLNFVANSDDCDDTNPDINPNSIEICDNLDNNCNGQIDENIALQLYYTDSDNDGFGDLNTFLETCSQPAGYVPNFDDCDDSNPNIHPNASELCDGIDNNCDGQIDEGLEQFYYADFDNDGFGDSNINTLLCNPIPGFVLNSEDCDDSDPNIHPNSPELCDGIDNNCDGQIDEGLEQFYYADFDSDGFGDPNVVILLCDPIPGFVINSNDCDDSNPNIHPNATEVCDGIDNNCDGQIDEGLLLTTYFFDEDSDGFGDVNASIISCSQLAGTVLNSDDCDDNDALVNPNTTEICDGIDNNCDGQIDEGLTLTVYYNDIDSDGFGDLNFSIESCNQPAGFVLNFDDCNDNDISINPNAIEICDGIDNNCDGQIDEGLTLTTYYNDLDGDGFGDLNTNIISCSQPAGTVLNSDDCDDNDALVNPNATESCDGIDNNCDGQIDEGCSDCIPSNFTDAPQGLFEDQTFAGGTKTRLNWEHYSDATDGCIVKGGTINSLDIGEPYSQTPGQVLVQGALINNNGGLNYSAQLTPNASFALFNPNLFPAGPTGGLVPGAFYKWQVMCGCIIDSSLPFPDRLAASNVILSPWSEFDLFTNLSEGAISNESNGSSLGLGSSLHGLSIFPNPADDYIIIQTKARSIYIYDILGKEMYRSIISNNQIKVDINKWANGIYLVRVFDNGLDSFTQKRLIVH